MELHCWESGKGPAALTWDQFIVGCILNLRIEFLSVTFNGCTHRAMILCDGAIDSHRK